MEQSVSQSSEVFFAMTSKINNTSQNNSKFLTLGGGEGEGDGVDGGVGEGGGVVSNGPSRAARSRPI